MVKHQFEDFLMYVADEYKDFVTTIHGFLKYNYKTIIRSTKNGLSLSYSQPKWIRILCFSFRKNKLVIHINIEYHAKYLDVLNCLPQQIVNSISSAADCKKLIGSVCGLDKLTGFACGWDNCEPGYDFYIGGNHYQKCRFHCLKLNVDIESIPFLLKIVENEHKERCDR